MTALGNAASIFQPKVIDNVVAPSPAQQTVVVGPPAPKIQPASNTVDIYTLRAPDEADATLDQFGELLYGQPDATEGYGEGGGPIDVPGTDIHIPDPSALPADIPAGNTTASGMGGGSTNGGNESPTDSGSNAQPQLTPAEERLVEISSEEVDTTLTPAEARLEQINTEEVDVEVDVPVYAEGGQIPDGGSVDIGDDDIPIFAGDFGGGTEFK